MVNVVDISECDSLIERLDISTIPNVFSNIISKVDIIQGYKVKDKDWTSVYDVVIKYINDNSNGNFVNIVVNNTLNGINYRF